MSNTIFIEVSYKAQEGALRPAAYAFRCFTKSPNGRSLVGRIERPRKRNRIK